jgi:hypothetical protein
LVRVDVYTAALDKENIVLTKRILCLYLAVSITLLPACSQTSRIISDPEGAEVEINNIYIGTTPCNYISRSGLPDQAYIKLSKEGYEPVKNGIIKKEYRADISLLLLICVFVPYFFSARFEDDYLFALKPKAGTIPQPEGRAATVGPSPVEGPQDGAPGDTTTTPNGN